MREREREISINHISLSELTAQRYLTTTSARFATNRVYVDPIPKQTTLIGCKTPLIDRSAFVRHTESTQLFGAAAGETTEA